jgi:AcrR family transcriptional regulator
MKGEKTMKIDKSDIIVNARDLFYSKGFKDTSVSDITQKSGIAVGSFYKYFKSKEEVFLDVFMTESIQLKKQIMENVDLNRSPVDVVKEIILNLFLGIRSNPVLREWYSRDVYSKLETYLQEDGTKVLEDYYSYDLFLTVIKKWQAEGKFRTDIESEHILAILNTFQYIDLHKEDIGEAYFPQLLEYVIEFVVKGLYTND